jgi:hypoxanthine-DNA glycosylase
MDDRKIYSFPPIVDDESRVLVLGTMPGAESLRQQRYYAYERNHFWAIIFALFGFERPADYEARVRFLHEKKIAVWDVLETCERSGSLDADIRKGVPNRIAELLESHPEIKAVFPNGKGAAKLFNQFILPRMTRSLPGEALPSTSPAYAIPFEKKLDGWRKILEFL